MRQFLRRLEPGPVRRTGIGFSLRRLLLLLLILLRRLLLRLLPLLRQRWRHQYRSQTGRHDNRMESRKHAARIARPLRPIYGDGARACSALPRLEPAVGLVDDVDPALAPHEAVVAVAADQGFQRVTDFHDAL